MIIDSHAYCFEPLDMPGGYATAAERLDLVQRSMADHFQPAWRVRDRTPARSDALTKAQAGDPSSLGDVRFRMDRERGRVVWTVDGEDFTKYQFPPNLRGMEFSPHSLVAEMDYNDVDVALLHTYHMLTRNKAFLAYCKSLYPGRLLAMVPVDESRIPSETDAVIREVVDGVERFKLDGIKFMPGAGLPSAGPWWDGRFRPFWDAVTGLGVPIFFTLGFPGAADARQGFIDELSAVADWSRRYPDTKVSVTHGFPWRAFLDPDRKRFELPAAMWAPFRDNDVHLEVCLPTRIGDLFDFPYRECWEALEAMVEHIGADRLMWGSDLPFQNRFCTYAQSRQYIEKYCTFLSKDQVAAILGGSAAKLLGVTEIPPPAHG